MSSKCPRCGKTVYAAEKATGKLLVAFASIITHVHWLQVPEEIGTRSGKMVCLTCKTCNKRVDSTTMTEHGGEAYCKNCYAKQFGPGGYGYGGGAGTLQFTNNAKAPQMDH